MFSNSIGKCFVVTCFGESHGQCIGVVIDGCPPGLSITSLDIQGELDKRRSISPQISSPRHEEDKVEILSGLYNSHTTGAPLCMIVWNKEIDSTPYEELRWKPRPGHADFQAFTRYHGFNDYRGGGRFSGRVTVAFVMAGAIAKKILSKIGVEVLAHSVEIAGIRSQKTLSVDEIRKNVYRNTMRCADLDLVDTMETAVQQARREGNSVGGIVECIALNLPVGVGDPIFDSLDADLAKIIFDIPGVKGVEFGRGFTASRLKGSENNDQYALKDGRVVPLTNNAGGVLGGLSNGMPIVLRVGVKPTPSIPRTQQTVDLAHLVEVPLKIQGSHDACIVPRAVPVVESAVAIVLVDHLLRLGMVKFE